MRSSYRSYAAQGPLTQCQTAHGIQCPVPTDRSSARCAPPQVLRANREKIEAKCELVARYLALPPPPRTYSLAATGFERVCYWVDQISDELRIPTSLQDIGLTASSTKDLGVKAAANPTGWTNPIQFTPEEYEDRPP